MHTGAFDKAIPLLTDLVNQEPGWQDGPLMLTEAYAGSGRNADAIAWLQQHAQDDPRLLQSLADFYEREHRWPDAAATYGAHQLTPRNTELKTRYASALMMAGGAANLGKARGALNRVVSARANDVRALYLLSQVERRLGDLTAAEAAARRVIAQNSGSPWGYYALAETLEEARTPVSATMIDELAPVVADRGAKADPSFDIGILLPHLGFAYQETGQIDKAIATFEDARKRSPKDPALAVYLIEAQIAGKKYAAAIDTARAALVDSPFDLRLTRLQAQALLRRTGKADEGLALLRGRGQTARRRSDGLSRARAGVHRRRARCAGREGAAGCADAFPIGQRGGVRARERLREAEEVHRCRSGDSPGAGAQCQNAPALNYLGYMLAERGERLDESVTVVKQALQIEPGERLVPSTALAGRTSRPRSSTSRKRTCVVPPTS